MKTKRLKRSKGLVSFYRNNFSLVPPYKVLLDGTFCLAALENKINLKEQVGPYLGAETHLFTTPCVLNELTLLGDPVYGALHISKQLDVYKCRHKPLKSIDKCFLSLLKRVSTSQKTNTPHFITATQDRSLTDEIRELAGRPLLFINYNTVLLEKPSKASLDTAKILENNKSLNISELQMDHLKAAKVSILGEKVEEELKRKRRKGPKGPNPLSCKKRKNKQTGVKVESSGKRKSKRVKRSKSDGTPSESLA